MKTKNLLSIILVIFSINIFGQIIHVPNDYISIQGAINAAMDGDTVLVANGAYPENINFKGKAITVASQYLIDGDPSHVANTIIDGSQPKNKDSAAVVMFVSGEDTTSVIYGFTLTSGAGIKNHTNKTIIGGGISLYLSGAKILKNRIIENAIEITDNEIEEAYGGGIGSSSDFGDHWLIIEDNEISENTIQTSEVYGQVALGGGIYLTSNARVINNTIRENETYGSFVSWGAGNYFESMDAELIRTIFFKGNDVQFNKAEGDMWVFGGGVYANTCHTFIENNVISNNLVDAGIRGISGGITLFTYAGGETHLINNEIVGNECYATEDVWGSAINLSHASDIVEIVGNNISSNIGIAGGTGYGTISIYIDETAPQFFSTEYIIEGNRFINNQIELGGALYIMHSLNSTIQNNLFAANQATNGGAIDFYQGALKASNYNTSNESLNSVLANNTFVYNHSTVFGGAVRNNFDSDKLLSFNNLFWENSADNEGQDIFYYGAGQGMFIANSFIDETEIAGDWTGWENVYGDPPILNDSLHLSGSSLCINTGLESIEFNYEDFYSPQLDIDGEGRPIYGGVDIGADEYFVVGVQPNFSDAADNLNVYPNPFSKSAKIEFQLSTPTYCVLKMYNSFGTELKTIAKAKFNNGKHTLNLNSNNLPDGMYYLKFWAGDKVINTKILHMNY